MCCLLHAEMGTISTGLLDGAHLHYILSWMRDGKADLLRFAMAAILYYIRAFQHSGWGYGKPSTRSHFSIANPNSGQTCDLIVAAETASSCFNWPAPGG